MMAYSVPGTQPDSPPLWSSTSLRMAVPVLVAFGHDRQHLEYRRSQRLRTFFLCFNYGVSVIVYTAKHLTKNPACASTTRVKLCV